MRLQGYDSVNLVDIDAVISNTVTILLWLGVTAPMAEADELNAFVLFTIGVFELVC